MKIVLLGPAGTYSEEAGRKYKKGVDFIYANFISDIFDIVINKKADIGIVPVENKINGTIGETLDNLYQKNIFVIDEIVLEIKNVLASQSSNFDIIASHPQPLGQCRSFIQGLGKKTEEVASTAKAMELASSDKRYAAIGNRLAAEMYHLKVLGGNIQDKEKNQTRFFVISQKPNEKYSKKVKYKTSIAINPGRDRPGLLFDILKVFKDDKVNLTKIESRPSKEKLGEYIFYVDMEGNLSDKKIKSVLSKLNKIRVRTKIFGSYKKQY